LRNEDNILLPRDFNASTATNQAIILNKYSNPNSLWLYDEFVLANKYKRNFEAWPNVCLVPR